MEFTAGLEAQNARLTCQPAGSDIAGKNRQLGGKKYKRWGNHGEKDAFTLSLKRGDFNYPSYICCLQAKSENGRYSSFHST